VTLRQCLPATVTELTGSGITDLRVPACFGGQQAPLSAILDPVRGMAHGVHIVGHVDFDYTQLANAGALRLGIEVSRTPMI
jgi:hypothetical protein